MFEAIDFAPILTTVTGLLTDAMPVIIGIATAFVGVKVVKKVIKGVA